MELQITSIEQLHEYGMGKVVRLPDFAEGQPFVARIRRPSLLSLASNGKIPNSLLKTANDLFMGKGMNTKNQNAMKDLSKVLESISRACFIEPTYEQLEEAKVELTDEQLMFIFNYAQQGNQALEKFRIEPQHSECTDHVKEVPENSLGDTSHT